jgi:hypothetical protein
VDETSKGGQCSHPNFAHPFAQDLISKKQHFKMRKRSQGADRYQFIRYRGSELQ